MADLTLVQGDSKPDINGALTLTSDGTPINLTNATSVSFQMRKADDKRYTINGAAAIVNTAAGLVSYSFGANDLQSPGQYIAQWEIHWNDATEQTTDPANTIEVRRQ